MQGRLSPSRDGRFQFFPQGAWKEEFIKAKELGFDAIDWFLDIEIPDFDPINDIWQNPVVLEEIDRVRQILPIGSIDCGRYSTFGPNAERTRAQFPSLLKALAPRLTTKVVVLPLLEANAPKIDKEKAESQETVRMLGDVAAAEGLGIALETEMPAAKLIPFLEHCGEQVSVCYDTGNAASYGFDLAADITALANYISLVHIKDRLLGGGSTFLGTGNVNFDEVFKALKTIGYHGQYTLQAWRGENYLDDAQSQRAFVKKYIS